MDIFLTICLSITIICSLLTIRNVYTFYCSNEAIDLISIYSTYLINQGKYEIGTNYQDEMQIGYIEHLLSINLWGKYSMIKPKYIKVLKVFVESKEEN